MKRKLEKLSPKKTLALKALGVTILAFILSEMLVAPFSASTSSIFSSPQQTDFILSDFYAQVADKRPVRELSNEMVVVDIDRAGREEIAELISLVNMCGPKAVGVDINFEVAHEDDSILLSAVAESPCIVLPLGLQQTSGGDFEIADKPFFYSDMEGVNYGAANLPGKKAVSSIREFPVSFKMKDGSEQLSFVAVLAQKAAPEAYQHLRERKSNLEAIDYASLEFPIMSIPEVYEHPEALDGKIVLIGAVNEASDMHATPVARSMAGLSIHAHALATVLKGKYYTQLPKWVDYAIAYLLCYIIVMITMGMTSKFRGILLRTVQVSLAYLSIRIGYSLYVDYNIIANFSITFLMVAFGPFAVDIWNGLHATLEVAAAQMGRFKTWLASRNDDDVAKTV